MLLPANISWLLMMRLDVYKRQVVNGGGYIDREYGLGRGRTDLLIRKPLTDGYGCLLYTSIKERTRGDAPNLEYLPFYLPLLELPAFQIALYHKIISVPEAPEAK